jgi:DNA-directed RNA polymerase subunit M/transcription elongation factor TFIIS
MLCASCHNILQKVTDTGKLKYLCLTCGTEYAAKGHDTLTYIEDNRSYSLSKDGRTIWYYPANPKVWKECTKCKLKMIAWEHDVDMNKIYGCQCGYSWKEFVTAR